MNRTLTDEDIEILASRIVEILGERLNRAGPRTPPPPEPTPPPLDLPAPVKIPEKLSYNLKELSMVLGISKVSIYRLEARGLLKSLRYLRTKIYTRKEVERFLNERDR